MRIPPTGNLHLAIDKTSTGIYEDKSLYHSRILHSLPEDLSFTDTVTFTVKTPASLQESGIFPQTEGFDLQVIRGMGENNSPVIVTEFWDDCCPFGRGETFNRLPDLVSEIQQRGYYWYIVIYPLWEEEKIPSYCNPTESLDNSWGDVFSFRDYNLFSQPFPWMGYVLPDT